MFLCYVSIPVLNWKNIIKPNGQISNVNEFEGLMIEWKWGQGISTEIENLSNASENKAGKNYIKIVWMKIGKAIFHVNWLKL